MNLATVIDTPMLRDYYRFLLEEARRMGFDAGQFKAACQYEMLAFGASETPLSWVQAGVSVIQGLKQEEVVSP